MLVIPIYSPFLNSKNFYFTPFFSIHVILTHFTFFPTEVYSTMRFALLLKTYYVDMKSLIIYVLALTAHNCFVYQIVYKLVSSQELHFYYNLYCNYLVCSLKSMCIPSFVLIGGCVSIPIVMYGLRLFIVVLQELHCLPTN